MILNQLRNSTLALLGFLLLSSSCVSGQSSAPYNLIAIHFAGLHRYSASVAEVSITLPVVRGNQYSWNGATWSGNKALATSELIKTLGMNQQEVANQLKIDAGFANDRKAYLSQGYIDVQIDPQRTLDDAAKLAGYSVQITEGSQFHMGKIVFEGLPDAAAIALVKKWKLKPGDVYDATYPVDFLKNTAPKDLAQQGIMYRTAATKETPDPSTLLVDVHIQFR